MAKLILKLIGEGKTPGEPLEILTEGEVPKVGEPFVIEKEYPACTVTYEVHKVENKLSIPRQSTEVPKTQTNVYLLRSPGGYQKK